MKKERKKEKEERKKERVNEWALERVDKINIRGKGIWSTKIMLKFQREKERKKEKRKKERKKCV